MIPILILSWILIGSMNLFPGGQLGLEILDEKAHEGFDIKYRAWALVNKGELISYASVCVLDNIKNNCKPGTYQGNWHISKIIFSNPRETFKAWILDYKWEDFEGKPMPQGMDEWLKQKGLKVSK